MSAARINAGETRWARRYQTALSKHLSQGRGANLQPAFRMGHQAVALGLETLNLALIHEQALTALASSGDSAITRGKMIKRAKRFFAEAIVPIEKTHRAALEAAVCINQLIELLRQRTLELCASTRNLKRGITRRQAAEKALKKSGKRRSKLLQESRGLQNDLRDQTQKMLSVQEHQWLKTSRQLHGEIAQTLLAIDVRLLILKNAAKADTGTLKKKIAETQDLVTQSAKMIHRLAHEYGDHHEI